MIIFSEYWTDLHNGVHNWSSDSFYFALINADTVPTVDTASPRLGDFTEVVGAGYTQGGILLTSVFDIDAGIRRARLTQGTISWALNASGPEDVYYGLIVNDDAGADQAVAFVDMTEDGVTPLSLRSADIQWSPEMTSGRIYTL